jgi:hypothetical protein
MVRDPFVSYIQEAQETSLCRICVLFGPNILAHTPVEPELPAAASQGSQIEWQWGCFPLGTRHNAQ